MKGRTAHEEIIFKNAQPWVLCPWCSYRFIGDQNNDSYADCPVCGGRIFYDEVYF